MKKTPREILLQRHQAAATKLDVLRREVVSEIGQELRRESPRRHHFIFFANRLWEELVFPLRRIWGGLAATWIVILFINFANSEPDSPVTGQVFKPTREVQMAVKEQRRMFAELIAGPREEPIEPPRFLYKPRSDRRLEFKIA